MIALLEREQGHSLPSKKERVSLETGLIVSVKGRKQKDMTDERSGDGACSQDGLWLLKIESETTSCMTNWRGAELVEKFVAYLYSL